MYKILSVNPGSTSTKLAYYEDETLVCGQTIRHSADELKRYPGVMAQHEFRKQQVLDGLRAQGIDLADLSAVVGRGGLVRPIESGVYEVNDRMVADLRACVGGIHASNLGALIAREIADGIPGCRAFMADPVVVDELQDVARVSGLPQVPRRSIFHALNQKAIARRYAEERGMAYEELDLVVAHLGGGVSVSAHRHGRVVDTNQALDGFGPFSPERAGTLDAGQLVRMAFSGEYTQEQMLKMLAGRGGLMAHLGTNDARAAYERALAGDQHARLVLEAMAYGAAKEIGAMHVVLEGRTDAILLTGGIAYNEALVAYIRRMVGGLAPVRVYPGEDEMEALAMSGLRVLRGEPTKEY